MIALATAPLALMAGIAAATAVLVARGGRGHGQDDGAQGAAARIGETWTFVLDRGARP